MKLGKNGKVFESQEELTGYITGKVKGGFITSVEVPCFMPSSQIDVRPLKKLTLDEHSSKSYATRIDKNRVTFVFQEERF